MNTFGSLYRYECKKVWNRKLVKFSFVLCLVLITIMGMVGIIGRNVVDGQVVGSAYDEIRLDQSYARKLNGREINQQLLEEMVSAYRKIPDIPGQDYTFSSEYQEYARPYSAIFNFVRGTSRLLPANIFLDWEPNEQELYDQRQVLIKENWENLKLSDDEITFWQQKESKIEKPVVYQQHEGYIELMLYFRMIGFIAILFVSISLSSIFPEEHNRKTDQLVLSSPMGKRKLYWAKISAGMSYAAGATLVFLTLISALIFSLYGAEGFGAAFQLHYELSSNPISIGQAVLIAYANMLITVVFISVIVMFLSELLRSSMAALAISAGLLIASIVVAVPEYYRNIAQIWSWLPWRFLAPWNVFGSYTLSVFGMHLPPWQAVPIIYVLFSIAVAWGEKLVYERYQVYER